MDVTIDDLIDSPPPGVRHTMILGPEPVAIGADTAVHGDYDGDGLADLAFCNPYDGPPGQRPSRIGARDLRRSGRLAGADRSRAGGPAVARRRSHRQDRGRARRRQRQRGDILCYSAAGGDVDGDGGPDLVVNEMTGNGFMPDGGDPGTELDPAVDVGNLLLINGASLLDRVLLDVDGNGVAEPLTDGLLILRFLFGFTGTALTQGALGAGATRTGPEIEEYLARAGAALDADGDDTLQPLTDGILALRFLFGFSGTVLVTGALDPDATRTDPAAIAGFLDRLMP